MAEQPLVYDVGLRTRFRGITRRSGMLIRGRAGWAEWSPFPEYTFPETESWWAATIEAAELGFPEPRRSLVPVNSIVPAVGPDRAGPLALAGGCTTAKVKVGERGQDFADDLDRVAAVRAALGPGGRVRVDAYGRTTAEGVWSLGDASSPYQLKHVANHEARQVAHNLVHPDDLRPFDHRHVPSAVFTHPQIAAVGATQRELIESGRRYAVYVQSYGSTAYGWAMEDEAGIVKVLADPDTGELLGAHLMGAHSSSLIQPIVQAMSFGQPAHEVARGQYWIHPALSEVIENALLGLELGG